MPAPVLNRERVPLLIAVLLMAAAAASSQSSGSDPRQVPTFRTGVSAVLVDALVLDARGLPVMDLTREDFTVFENGEEQTIASFDVTDWRSYVAATTNDAGGGTVGSLNAYPRRFVIIVNRQGARFEYLVRAKRALSEFIVEWMADGDEAMVVDIGHSTKIVRDLGSRKEELLESVRNLSAMPVDVPLGADRAARRVYRELSSLAESLIAYPGRKIVVLLSMELATFALPGSRLSNEIQSLKASIDALNQANASVYTIDLSGSDGYDESLTGGLAALAHETGGRYFRNHVSFGPPLRRVGRENQRYYLLGYTATDAELDGTYRRIVVRVRRDDVSVIARPGYHARPPGDETATSGAEESAPDLRVAAKEAGDFGLLPRAVEITTYLLRSEGGRVRVPISIALPSDLLRSPDGEGRRLELVIARSGDGGELRRFAGDVDPERFYLLRQVELEPGAYLARIRVTSGAEEIYRSSMGIEVPAGYGDRFGLSSILPIVSPREAHRIDADLPILPSPEIPRGAEAHVLVQVFPGTDEPSRSAEIRYAISAEDGRELRSGRQQESLTLSKRAGEATPVVLSLPTTDLREGSYRIEIVAEDRSRGRRAASELELRVR